MSEGRGGWTELILCDRTKVVINGEAVWYHSERHEFAIEKDRRDLVELNVDEQEIVDSLLREEERAVQ